MLHVPLIYTETNWGKNCISPALNISSREPSSFKINNEMMKKITHLRNAVLRYSSKIVSSLFPSLWLVPISVKLLTKLLPICSLLMRLLACWSQQEWLRRQQLWGQKSSLNLPSGEDIPRTSPPWLTRVACPVFKAHLRNSEASEPTQTRKVGNAAWWLRVQGWHQTGPTFNYSSASCYLCGLAFLSSSFVFCEMGRILPAKYIALLYYMWLFRECI